MVIIVTPKMVATILILRRKLRITVEITVTQKPNKTKTDSPDISHLMRNAKSQHVPSISRDSVAMASQVKAAHELILRYAANS